MSVMATALKRVLRAGSTEPTAVNFGTSSQVCELMCRVDPRLYSVVITDVNNVPASTISVSIVAPYGSTSIVRSGQVLAGVDVEFAYMHRGDSVPSVAFRTGDLMTDGRWQLGDHKLCVTLEAILLCAGSFRVACCPASNTRINLPTAAQLADDKFVKKWAWSNEIGDLNRRELRIPSRPYLTRPCVQPYKIQHGQLFATITDDSFWATKSNMANFVSAANAQEIKEAYEAFAAETSQHVTSVTFDGKKQGWHSAPLQFLSSRLCADFHVQFVSKFTETTVDIFMSVQVKPVPATVGRTISWYKDHFGALGIKPGPRVCKLAEFAELWSSKVGVFVPDWFPDANAKIASVEVSEVKSTIFSVPDDGLKFSEKRGVHINTFCADPRFRTVYGSHLARPLRITTWSGDTIELFPWATIAQETWPAKIVEAHPGMFKDANFKVYNRHADDPQTVFSLCDVVLEQEPPEGLIVFDEEDDDNQQPQKRSRSSDV